MIMKLLVIVFSLLLSFSEAFCQGGNLQFNRVLNFTSGANYTVPQGKVLKIESLNIHVETILRANLIGCDTFSTPRLCYYSTGNVSHTPVQIGALKLNSNQGTFENVNANGQLILSTGTQQNSGCNSCSWNYDFVLSLNGHNVTMPIWLSESEVVKIINYQSLLPALSRYSGIHISAIEFNVVP